MGLGVAEQALPNVVGSIAILVFAAWVATVRPTSPPQRMFIAFAATFGTGGLVSNLVWPGSPAIEAALWGAVLVLFLAAAGFVVMLAWTQASTAGPWRWRALALGALLVTVSWTGLLLHARELPGELTRLYAREAALMYEATFALAAVMAAALAGAVMLAGWARRAGSVQQAALVACALAMYPATYGGALLMASVDGMRFLGVAGFVGVAVHAATWLSAQAGRAGRNAALLPLALFLLGMTIPLAWAPATSRVLMTALLAYAVVRHHAMSIDSHVRFGISRGTLAGFFFAVFFVSGEAAQAFFGDSLGSQYAGIVAAGLLVFAIAPLSRAADRLASRAVPGGPQLDGEADLERAWEAASRGRMTAEEEMALTRLAERSGLGASTVMKVRQRRGAPAATRGSGRT